MQTTTLGRSGKSVSRLGLGLAALGRPGYINLGHAQDLEADYDLQRMQDRVNQMLDLAWQAGITYFDAARSYGKAEQFLANWLRLRDLSPDAVTIGSKWGYTYTADWQVQADQHEVKQHTLAKLNEQWEKTQAELGGQLDLYQIHSATLESGVLENHEVLDRLSQLKQSGTLIGLSVSGPKQATVIETALNVKIDGRPLFDTVQATWNLLERSAGPALQAAHDQGVGVIIKEAVANGRLTTRNQEASFRERRQSLQAIADQLGTTIDGLAIAAVLAQPFVDVVLSGASAPDQLTDNLAALEVAIDSATARELESVAEPADIYWETRSQLAWN